MAKKLDYREIREQLIEYLHHYWKQAIYPRRSRALVDDLRSANLLDVLPKDIQAGLNALGSHCFQPECSDPPASLKEVEKIINLLRRNLDKEVRPRADQAGTR